MFANVKVRVPGTTANCGPGFDAVGIACTIYNYFELTLSNTGSLMIEIEGEGQGLIPADERNVAYQAVMSVLNKVNFKPAGIKIKMTNNIPLARGLGSSAAAIVAGLTAANAATGNKLTKQEIALLATRLEGHPDNVSPAIFGGVTLSVVSNDNVDCLSFVPPAPLKMVIVVPHFGLSTKAARQVLPKTVPFSDAVYNVSRASMLIAALTTGKYSFLNHALDDRLHQPYRQKLIPGMEDVFKAAAEQGALGTAISGAGPCLIAFAENNAEQIGEAMVKAFEAHKTNAHYLLLDIDREGAKLIL